MSSSRRAGFTLVELMIAAAIVSIGILGMVHTFRYVTIALQKGKYRILSNNLAQEQIEILKNYPYYALLVTTNAYTDTRFSPNLYYDGSTGYYAPETMTVSGVTFTRAVRIDFANLTGTTVSTVSATSVDPGLKQITVYVIWQETGEDKQISLANLVENPSVAPLDATIQGTVYESGGGPLEGALVWAQENPNWYDYADASGFYQFNVHHGTYTMKVTTAGYFDQTSTSRQIFTSEVETVGFTLTPMDLGTFYGTAWVNDHPVLSKVVGSSENSSGYFQEFVEVFNPTTFTWTMSDVGLVFQRRNDTDENTILIDYNTASIAPGGFYLFANTATIEAAGTTLTADAVWSASNSTSDFPYFATDDSIIPVSEDGGSEGSAAIRLYQISTGETLDELGWNRNNSGHTAPFYETSSLAEGIGLEKGEQYVRRTSTSGYSSSYGPAYDSGTNTTDWFNDRPMTIAPANSSTTRTVISGTPAIGATASSSDGNSSSGQAASTGSPPYAGWTISNVSTGTWTVSVTSGSVMRQYTSATISSDGQSASVPSSSTSPSWPVSGVYAALLSDEATLGYVSGYVRDITGAALSNIYMKSGATTTNTNASGFYSLSLSTGSQTVRANADLVNAQYVEESEAVTVSLGVVTTQNYSLSRGGTVKGYVTSGTSPIPNINVAATKDGTQFGSGVTDASGSFYIYNLSTGTYTIEPSLDPASVSDPTSYSAAVSAAASVDVGTYTITSAFGTLAGSVYNGTTAITTGVLIVVSSVTIPTTPTAIDGESSAASTVYYMAASLSDGSYEILARGSTYFNYYVSAYYPVISNTGAVTISTKSVSGVSILSGQTTTKNFSY